MQLQLSHGVRVELVGDDVVALDRFGGVLHHATGTAAAALRLVVDGADVPEHLAEAVATLTANGVLQSNGWSRRKMLLAGGAVGITTFALSAPQAAASAGCTGDTANIRPVKYNAASTGTYKPGPGVTSIVLRGWGGGGGGAGGTGSSAGGGGGGGGYSQLTISGLAACTTYYVTVSNGSGGLGATAVNTDGKDGTDIKADIGTVAAGTQIVKDFKAAKGNKGTKDGKAGAASSAGASGTTGVGYTGSGFTGAVGGAGGVGQLSSRGGGGGGAAGSGGAGGTGSAGANGGAGGVGGAGTWGGGGGGAGSTGTGAAGSTPGGGGGGGANGGGNGADGWFYIHSS